MKNNLSENQKRKIKNKRKRNRSVSFIIILVLILVSMILIFKAYKNFTGNKDIKNDNNKKQEITNKAVKDSKNDKTKVVKESKKEYTEESVESVEENIDNTQIKIEPKVDGKIENPFANIDLSDKEIEKKTSELPDILQQKISKYPESKSTILQYEEYKDSDYKIDLNKDIEDSKLYDRKVKLPYFNQWDARWGFKEVDDMYVAVSGCGPTTLSMIYTGLTNDLSMNPYEMAKYAFEMKTYDGNGGKYNLFTKTPTELGLNAQEISANRSSIKEALDNNRVIVALVRNYGIGDFTVGSGHYIILSEYTDDDKLKIYDVNSYENTNKDWEFDRILNQTDVLYSIWK